jgi:hypothetical protein
MAAIKSIVDKSHIQVIRPEGTGASYYNPVFIPPVFRLVKEDKSEEDKMWILRNPSCLHQ